MSADHSDYVFQPSERPAFPGSPYTPHLSLRRRFGYLGVALIVGITATLGNALVTVNVSAIAGSAGLYVAEASWLPAMYVAFNASANLILVKSRAQFGIPPVVLGLLSAYAMAALAEILWPGFAGAIVVRAISGLAAAALTTYTTYHLVQALPVQKRPIALVIGVVIPQFATPLARMLPVELLSTHNWRGVHEVELAMALLAMAATLALPLPPTERTRSFMPLDFVSIGLLLPANVMLCGVLGLGRVVWWTDSPDMGWLLGGAVACYMAVFLIERHRQWPLLQLHWLGSVDILRFAAVAVLVRLALAEQTYGAVGLLTAGGLINDQLACLFGWVLVAMILGVLTAVMTLSLGRLPYLVMASSIVIGIGAVLDSHTNSLSRPAQLYASQMLLGFGTSLFMGPALLYGFSRMAVQGHRFLVSFVVLFSTTQNIGGLAGSALLGTLQIVEARVHATAMAGGLLASDPAVVSRLGQESSMVAAVIADPASRAAEGGALLGNALSEQASAAAFDDIFALVAVLAFATALYIAFSIGIKHWRGTQHGVVA